MEINIYQLFKEYGSITTDSRNCSKNSLFFALKGDNFDGNQYAEKALRNGCSYAIIDNKKYAKGERYILVKNVLKTLQQLANKHRKILGTKVIGVTGTNGKTTTKELIASVLSQKFNVHYTKGNFNNHIGVPITLLQLELKHEIAVIEMGANHPKEIEELCQIVEPDYGIITNVGKAHLEGFGSFEGVMKTKSELYQYLSQKNRPIFINSGNDYLNEMATKSGYTTNKNQIQYAETEKLNNHLVISTKTVTDDKRIIHINCVTPKEKFTLDTHLIGEYNTENVLAATAIGFYFGLNSSEIKQGIEDYTPTNSRSEYQKTKLNIVNIDAYNANPDSMNQSIKSFANSESKHKTLILGDMLELGNYANEEHQKVIDLIERRDFEEIFLVGNEFQKTERKKAIRTYQNVGQLIEYIQQKPLKNRTILVKGSQGIKLNDVLKYL